MSDGRTEALIGGGPDIDTPQANAVVRVGGCTGTLIAPDIVLTAQHCIGAVQYPNTRAFTAGCAALAVSRGAMFVVTTDPDRLWARQLGPPFFIDRVTPGGFGPLTALAPLAHTFIGATVTGELVEFDDRDAPRLVRLGAAPARICGLANVNAGLWAATADGQLLFADVSHLASGRVPEFRRVGHAQRVRAMSAVNGTLYAVADNRLWMRPPTLIDENWTDIGHANEIMSMAAITGRLVAQSRDGKWWIRWPVPWDTPWHHAGTTRETYTALAANGTVLRGTTAAGELRMGDVSLNWENIGPAEDIVAMTAHAGELFAATSTYRLVKRRADHTERSWQDIDHANNVVGTAARLGELVCRSADGRLWRRVANGRDIGWREIPEDGTAPTGTTALTAARDGSIYTAAAATLWKRANLDAGRSWTPAMECGGAVALASEVDVGPSAVDDHDRLFALTSPDFRTWFHPVVPQDHFWLVVSDDWLRPDCWHAYSTLGAPGPTVSVGLSGQLGTYSATHVALPGGWNDIALLRIDGPVDPRDAVPMPVLTGPPSGNSPTFWQTQSFTLAGWGRRLGGTLATQRQIGQATGGGEWPMSDPGGYLDANRMRVSPGAGGAAGMPGDSGGPLLWTSPSGIRYVIGAFNVGGGGAGVYYLTFTRGSTDTAGVARPNVGAWIEAALAGRFCEKNRPGVEVRPPAIPR